MGRIGTGGLACNFATRGAVGGIVVCLLLAAGRPDADVVILQDSRVYSGVIERWTTDSVHLFDGNLRRILALNTVKRVIEERPDTSWILVGDRMLRQRDWEAAAHAYRKALEVTGEPDVPLRRLATLRAHRYYLPGAEEAESLLESKDYRNAARSLAALVQKARTVAQRHYWLDRLARAYVGLGAAVLSSGTLPVNDYLVYALSIAPDCGPAHALLARHLRLNGFAKAAREELLLALDFDPVDPGARRQCASLGLSWRYTPDREDSSSLRLWAQRRPPVQPGMSAPLTTAGIAQALQQPLMRTIRQPARLLLAAYLMDPTVALANQGELPYAGYNSIIPKILQETRLAKGTTAYDKVIIGSAIKVRIDPRFIRAIARVRSNCKPDYVSPTGERGFIPLSRRQWAIAARYAGVNWTFDGDSKDVGKNVEIACRYLDWLRRKVLSPYAGTHLEHLERID